MTKEQPVDQLAGAKNLLKNPKAKRVGIIAIVVLLIVGGVFAYKNLVSGPADEKAQTQITEAITKLNNARQMQQQYLQVVAAPDSLIEQQMRMGGMITTTNADSAKKQVADYRANAKKQVDDLFNQVLKGQAQYPGLIKLANGGGNAGNMANYLAGVTYYMMGNVKEAIKYLEDFSPKGDLGVSPQALATLASCYVSDKQIDKAIEAYKDAASEADNASLSPLYLIEAGKLLESQKKKEDAHALYVEIKEKYPTFGLSQQGMLDSEVDKYIERTK